MIPATSRLWVGVVFATGVLLLTAAPVEAHKRHTKPAAADTTGASGGRGGTADTGAAHPARREPGPEPGASPDAYPMPAMRHALFDHMHNKVVHFPIVLAFAGALLLILARRKPELEPVAFWVVWLATLGALAAYFSGVFSADEFKGEPKEWLVGVHQKWGIAVGLAHAVWVLTLLRKSARRYAWIWGLVVVALVGVAAFVGGVVAHGE